MILEWVTEAVAAGAREERACELLGLSRRTLARWRAEGGGEDGRAAAGSPPAHKLSDAERERVREIANGAEHRDLSPRQIVPLLADRGQYVASESTFYRVLREAGELAHRSHARPARVRKPDEHVARAPNRVWSWDITYLRTQVRGIFVYLYLAVDVYSRKIVGWEVHEEESAEHAARLIEQATAAEQVDRDQLVLHADNGGPMRGSTLLATLQRLGVVASFSRPSVSDDNPFAEALFRTLKYRPGFPRRPFANAAQARAWVTGFVAWYNREHLHSGIRYVTPADRHEGRDKVLLARRHRLYLAARDRHPRRWTGPTRNWTPIGAVYLNPVKQELRVPPIAKAVS
jgi:transposase InsO family protein